ncbi:cell division transport system permease protein [Sphingomonas zeicaulis]|uniref:cell division protein FtsX n=1 Tax=Sphingomonas zeicaulis TaxID=1632740 RepID=UPI003D1F6775
MTSTAWLGDAIARSFGSAADRRLLPEGRAVGPMPWVVAIMMFLAVLATAAGLGLSNAAGGLRADLAGRATVQIVEADPVRRVAATKAAITALENMTGVGDVRRVPDAEIAALLEPWLGVGGIDADLPVPVLIDLDIAPADEAAVLGRIETVLARVAPGARIDRHAGWLAPLSGLLGALTLLAGVIVALVAAATAATVVLTARGALDTHRQTIAILHLLGETDGRIAGLFQRRIGLDALFGGIAGAAAGIVALLAIGARIEAVGAAALAGGAIGTGGWLLLACLPVAGGVLATIAARFTILRALERLP